MPHSKNRHRNTMISFVCKSVAVAYGPFCSVEGSVSRKCPDNIWRLGCNFCKRTGLNLHFNIFVTRVLYFYMTVMRRLYQTDGFLMILVARFVDFCFVCQTFVLRPIGRRQKASGRKSLIYFHGFFVQERVDKRRMSHNSAFVTYHR